ncbi:hypothetical protein FQN55_009098 [Onygenales sp. PD_40]|nr:hypothetical protein FQN55_009098 [Onygenales sp. PD_40]KAK2785729.1 hypothetical protein FQN52_008278 [Onygenales sp. PD_12]KAK2788020.1 hypothetical protein FQN53_004217 [Emmonsiellopsis sp. PD_33]KAK2793119.1 hypothetical protein FQN51_001352 [Onygenales sp. PD_10]
MLWYLPRKYRPPILFKILLVCELPVTIALLALFGIASPDLYRTRLWQDGADNGFNSSPDQMVYELANYRPYDVPHQWSQFLTNFNLVISVLSMFFMLVKAPLFVLNVFYPPLSIVIHTGLTALYLISAVFQASPDMTDPAHPQPGVPWYLSKNCNVARRPSNVGYCQQAKSGFACTVIMLVIFAVHLGLAIFSCFPTEETREKQRQRLARRMTLEDLKDLKSPTYPMAPTTPGGTALPPMTPRTTAFNRLGGTTDLPLRNHFTVPKSPSPHPPQNFSIPSPPHSPSPPLGNGILNGIANSSAGESSSSASASQLQSQTQGGQTQTQIPMYFPPPPKKATK